VIVKKIFRMIFQREIESVEAFSTVLLDEKKCLLEISEEIM